MRLPTPPLLLLLLFPLLTTAQNAGLPAPDPRCTLGLCRPIGETMSACIGNNATPETISWADLMGGANITVNNSGVSVSMPKRLQCFCQSVGLERKLDTCKGCYVATNQEEYWTTGINNIKIVCGFTHQSGADSMAIGRKAVGIAVGVGLAMVVGDMGGVVGGLFEMEGEGEREWEWEGEWEGRGVRWHSVEREYHGICQRKMEYGDGKARLLLGDLLPWMRCTRRIRNRNILAPRNSFDFEHVNAALPVFAITSRPPANDILKNMIVEEEEE